MDPSPATIQYVRLDHRGPDVLVPQHFLLINPHLASDVGVLRLIWSTQVIRKTLTHQSQVESC